MVGDMAIQSWVPSGENVLDGDVAHIDVVADNQEGPFGINISNFVQTDLHPHVFWFNARSLKIREYLHCERPIEHLLSIQIHSELWFQGQDETSPALPGLTSRDGKNRPGSCAIGYGENRVEPWGFNISPNEDRDVHFCKVIATSAPVDLQPLKQAPPFDGISRSGSPWKATALKWFTRTATVVMQSKKTSY